MRHFASNGVSAHHSSDILQLLLPDFGAAFRRTTRRHQKPRQKSPFSSVCTHQPLTRTREVGCPDSCLGVTMALDQDQAPPSIRNLRFAGGRDYAVAAVATQRRLSLPRTVGSESQPPMCLIIGEGRNLRVPRREGRRLTSPGQPWESMMTRDISRSRPPSGRPTGHVEHGVLSLCVVSRPCPSFRCAF
jgi:hypothetical protein